MISQTGKERIQETLRRAVRNRELPGINLMILKDGEELFYCEEGYSNLEQRKKIRRDTIVRLYSMTKPVTAAAVMLLVERGLLDLAQSVAELIPGFADQKVCQSDGTFVPVSRPSTIRDLMNMTAGLVYLGDETAAERETTKVYEEIAENMYGEHPVTTTEMANRIGRCPLKYQPGEIWQYSSGADVLGAVVEAVTGKTFGAFLREELFQPLEMPDTDFYVPEEKQDRLMTAYMWDKDGTLVPYKGCNLAIMNDMVVPNAFESGGAGLVSTIDDYAHFAQMLMDGGVYRGKRLMGRRTVEFLTTGSLAPEQRRGMDSWTALEGYTYGNLMRVLTDPGRAMAMGSPGEYGWDGWEGCYFANCPADRLTILMMTQKTDSGVAPVVRRVRNIIFSMI
ncbi:MAG TPA: beta-lactamase family protein [Candidatus Fusicatenibacter merdavium]|uniref:Beta-lactamase family protein n=1 Tax=Candidatus Fusicatenibacter merdavium TaxID=2838600 RepID=A0A9D1XEH5_9FIRM|nr:beta-lactamase family protein [Candidatus Fusicatenibacter merdavium]